jgi:hypothetical protein
VVFTVSKPKQQKLAMVIGISRANAKSPCFSGPSTLARMIALPIEKNKETILLAKVNDISFISTLLSYLYLTYTKTSINTFCKLVYLQYLGRNFAV